MKQASYYSRRRPAQALYKPPRRSQNPEISQPVSAPSPPPLLPTPSVEDVQQNDSTTKSTKSKTARPSAEPYVPPSRRSQTLNKESLPSSTSLASSSNENKKEDGEDQEEEDEEEDWEKLLDGNENLLTNNLVEEVKFQIFIFFPKALLHFS